MFKHTIPFFVDLALTQVLREHKRIMQLHSFTENPEMFTEILKRLVDFSIELIDWQHGKLVKKDPIDYFQKQALSIEKFADDFSIEFWTPNLLDIAGVFGSAKSEEARMKNNYSLMLRTHYDIQRLRLLEQIRGAKLLQQNSDLGDEVEKVFFEYLKKNLDNDCTVVRGGHIFDLEGNRSQQIDIMVIPAKTLSICPADTENGKFNVLIDEVIAAISVKATLTPDSFKDAWENIQSIPPFKNRKESYPNLEESKHAWPLCFIVGANSDRIKTINEKWDELLKDGQKNQLQMFLSLEYGYSLAGNSSWPLIAYFEKEYRGSYNSKDKNLQSGLGLAWLLASISARSAVIANRPLASFKTLRKLLDDASVHTGDGCYGRGNKDYFITRTPPINDIIQWRWGDGVEFSLGKYLHNNLYVHSLEINGRRLINCDIILYPDKEGDRRYESRWFEPRLLKKENGQCHFREWYKNPNGDGYLSRTALFSLETGKELTDSINCS